MVLSAQLLVLCGLPEVHNGTTAEPALGDYLMRWPDELVSDTSRTPSTLLHPAKMLILPGSASSAV